MSEAAREVLVLALGNDIMGNDGVGLAAARALAEELGDRADVVLSPEAGLALLDHLEGYRRALILDAAASGRYPEGTVMELGPEDLGGVLGPSPHFTSLTDVLELGRRLGIPMPEEIRIVVMEVELRDELQLGLDPCIEAALPEFVEKTRRILAKWGCDVRGLSLARQSS